MKNSISVKELVKTASMSALIAVCSWITVPSAVPFTLQTFAIFFALEFCGAKNGTIAFLVYIALGAVGIPVFSGFGAGIGHIFGPTGGYLLGFVIVCMIYLFTENRFPEESAAHRFVIPAVALAACYLCGTVWFALQTGRGVGESLVLCVVPYIAPDAVKIALAEIVAKKLKRLLKI